MKISTILLILALSITIVFSKTREEWTSRSIYQVITDRFAIGDGSKPPCDQKKNGYCGGNFVGLKNKLDYIQDLGFNAIWISPIPKNQPDHFHGYAAMNIYEINDHFGTEQEFVDLLKEMRKRDIWLMLDVVANHMGNTDQDYSQNVPFNKPEHYHKYCMIEQECFENKDIQCIRECRLAGLADLDQSNPYVEITLLNWIHNLVKKYEIEGLRIDTVPEVHPNFWTKFSFAADVFTIGEVFDSSMEYCTDFIGNVDTVLNYPFYYALQDQFLKQKPMNGFVKYYKDWSKHINQYELQYLGLFSDNHDNARFLSEDVCLKEKTEKECKILYKSIQTMTLTSVGIPILYYGSEQYFKGKQDPFNREPMWNHFNTEEPFYKYIQKINKARAEHKIWTHDQIDSVADAQMYAYYRGEMLVCLTNEVSLKVSRNISKHGFEEGQKVCNIFSDNDCQIVRNGKIDVDLENGEAKIYVPAKQEHQQLQ